MKVWPSFSSMAWIVQIPGWFRRGRTSFAQEPLHGGGVFRAALLEEFEGDAPAQLRILGFIDQAHAATAQWTQNAIVTDCLVEHRGRGNAEKESPCDTSQGIACGQSGLDVEAG